jgi:hypothetical protein
MVSEEDPSAQKPESKPKKPSLKKIKRRTRSSSKTSPNVMIGIFGIIIVVVVGVILATPNVGQPNGGDLEEYQIPFSVQTIHGEGIELSAYQGRSLILYFSGVGCVPCQVHLPYLVDAYNHFNSTGRLGMASLDIQGYSVAELLIWEQTNGVTWKVCQDTGLTISSYFSVYSMPTLVVFDENGYELDRYVGTQDNATIWAIFEDAVS